MLRDTEQFQIVVPEVNVTSQCSVHGKRYELPEQVVLKTQPI